MTLDESYVHSLYVTLKSRARRLVLRGRFDLALRYLRAACYTAYTFYLGFCDKEIEEMLNTVGASLRDTSLDARGRGSDEGQRNICAGNGEESKGSGCGAFSMERCVLYDTISQDAQGLTMQYVDAIIASGLKMTYITEFDLDDPRSSRLKSTLLQASVPIVRIPGGLPPLQKARLIREKVLEASAGRLFMHLRPHDVEAVTAFDSLPREIVRYQINLTDHTFWAGAFCCDYVFDFRQYGAALCAKYRGISRERILLLPYYPMTKRAEFEGFPAEAQGKVKIFAGAAFYKIIDGNDTFFKLNKAILDANPGAVTLFAGGGDMALLESLIRKYSLQGRFIPIGQRRDIYECFCNSDIYLSSFPRFGALMAQFAAYASKPILAYALPGSGRVEEVVCQKTQIKISSQSIEELVDEASHLINDPAYREQRGRLMKECTIDRQEFNDSFLKCVTEGASPYGADIPSELPLRPCSISDILILMNHSKEFHKALAAILSLRTLTLSPALYLDGMLQRLRTSRLGAGRLGKGRLGHIFGKPCSKH